MSVAPVSHFIVCCNAGSAEELASKEEETLLLVFVCAGTLEAEDDDALPDEKLPKFQRRACGNEICGVVSLHLEIEAGSAKEAEALPLVFV